MTLFLYFLDSCDYAHCEFMVYLMLYLLSNLNLGHVFVGLGFTMTIN